MNSSKAEENQAPQAQAGFELLDKPEGNDTGKDNDGGNNTVAAHGLGQEQNPDQTGENNRGFTQRRNIGHRRLGHGVKDDGVPTQRDKPGNKPL